MMEKEDAAMDIKQVLFGPGEDAPSEEDAISAVAGALQISEYQLFSVAYAAWFGRSIPDRELEPLFMDYLLYGAVPPWVRDMVRKALERLAGGNLDPADYKINRSPPPSRAARLRGWLVIGSLFILIVLFSAMLAGSPSF
jgi:hypothetical protein